MRKLRLRIKKSNTRFNTALKNNRPHIAPKKFLEEMHQDAKALSVKIVNLVKNTLMVQMGANFAQTILLQDINADGIDLSISEIMLLSGKMFRIRMIDLLAEHFQLSKQEHDAIIANNISYFFPSSKSKMPVSAPPSMADGMMEILKEYGATPQDLSRQYKQKHGNKIRPTRPLDAPARQALAQTRENTRKANSPIYDNHAQGVF